MSMHDGHRQRLKTRFMKEGLDNFEQLHVLELLLFYCVPRKDTNPLAHRLLDRFGSLPRVLSASPEELRQVEGVSEGIITFFALRMAVERYYYNQLRDMEDQLITSHRSCALYFTSRFLHRSNETVFLLCLDAKCKVLDCHLVGEGSINSASIPIRRLVELALRSNATYVVLAHNHPSGLAIPSSNDANSTYYIAQALDAVDVGLIDHYVFADDDCVSMVQSGIFKLTIQSPWRD